jgi:hypothetical protein
MLYKSEKGFQSDIYKGKLTWAGFPTRYHALPPNNVPNGNTIPTNLSALPSFKQDF